MSNLRGGQKFSFPTLFDFYGEVFLTLHGVRSAFDRWLFYILPALLCLEINDSNLAEKWSEWKDCSVLRVLEFTESRKNDVFMILAMPTSLKKQRNFHENSSANSLRICKGSRKKLVHMSCIGEKHEY